MQLTLSRATATHDTTDNLLAMPHLHNDRYLFSAAHYVMLAPAYLPLTYLSSGAALAVIFRR